MTKNAGVNAIPTRIGIESPPAVAHVGDVGAQDDERRMGDVHDVELTEGHGQPEAHGGVEAAEHHARNERVQQEIDGEQREIALPETGNAIPSMAG